MRVSLAEFPHRFLSTGRGEAEHKKYSAGACAVIYFTMIFRGMALLDQIHDIVFPGVVLYPDADALACARLVDVQVFVLHGLDGLGKVGGVTFQVNGISHLEGSLVELDDCDV